MQDLHRLFISLNSSNICSKIILPLGFHNHISDLNSSRFHLQTLPPTSPSKSPQPPKLRMDSPQNPTTANCSQPPPPPPPPPAAHSPDAFYTKPYCCKLFTTLPEAQSLDGLYTNPYCCTLFTTSPAAQNPYGFSTNPTASNCSQPPHQPKVQLDFKQNPSAANCSHPPSSLKLRWTLHKTLLLQTVHNLPSSPSPDGFYTKPYL